MLRRLFLRILLVFHPFLIFAALNIRSLRKFSFRQLLRPHMSAAQPQSLEAGATTAADRFPTLSFDNRHVRSLPIDPSTSSAVREVSNAIFSRCTPTPVVNPTLIAASASALALLESSQPFDLKEEEALAQYLGGNRLIAGSEPLAHCYAGYQFGNFAGQLGDGAAILLGEVVNKERQRWELQLKGAGLTPFSRTADGRKVLRSSVREFLCSEAMHFLGIPTTRAGSVVSSDSTVARDPLYDGSQVEERCCVVSRIAPNFFRFGSLEVFLGSDRTGGREGPSARNEKLKKQFVDYLIASYYPELNPQAGGIYQNDCEEDKYRLLFSEVLTRTARLAAQWQGAGFVHGVLNTDNMSLMGVTLDYGPFAFMEHFDADFTPNGSDGSARYAYSRQPAICKFNLKKLGEALAPLLPPADAAQILSTFDAVYSGKYVEIMSGKLGLLAVTEADQALIQDFFETLSAASTDFTDAFVALTEYVEARGAVESTDPVKLLQEVQQKLVARSAAPAIKIDAIRRSLKISRLSLGLMPQQIDMIWTLLQSQDAAVKAQVAEMFGGAPVEAVAEEVSNEKRKLDKIKSGSVEIRRLEGTSPEEKALADELLWGAWLQRYSQRISGYNREEWQAAAAGMRQVNPTFVLRNWIAQEAIAAAEAGDYSKVRAVLAQLETPFDPALSTFNSTRSSEFVAPAPDWASRLICTCSS